MYGVDIKSCNQPLKFSFLFFSLGSKLSQIIRLIRVNRDMWKIKKKLLIVNYIFPFRIKL